VSAGAGRCGRMFQYQGKRQYAQEEADGVGLRGYFGQLGWLIFVPLVIIEKKSPQRPPGMQSN